METGFMNRITGLVIALVVGGLLVGGLLIPSIEGMTATETTFTNDGGYYRMAEYNAADPGTYTLEWAKSNTTVLVIDGVEFNANSAYGAAATTIIASDHWLIKYYSQNSESGYCQYWDGTTWGGSNTSKTLSLEATGGNVTITIIKSDDTEQVITDTYTKMYAIQPNATADIMKKPTESPYVLGNSEIYALGITTDVGLVRIDGNITDGVTIDVISEDAETIDNIVLDTAVIAGYKDLYVITKITFDCTISGTTTACTYNYFIVPYEVTAEKTQHMDATQIAMFGVISILGIVALVVVAANGIRNKY